MRILKNSFGITVTLSNKFSTSDMIGKMTGSCLERKPVPVKVKENKTGAEELEEETKALALETESSAPKLRSMSKRTKSKIRKKIF